MKRIPLLGGGYAFVDDCDYIELSKFRWRLRRQSDTLAYAIAAGGVTMHQLILPPQPGLMIDHIDGDGLNNRRDNLRYATRLQNNWNQKASKWCYRGLKGVYYVQLDCFRAAITVDYKKHELGRFATPWEAGLTYNNAAIKYYGQFARLNSAEQLIALGAPESVRELVPASAISAAERLAIEERETRELETLRKKRVVAVRFRPLGRKRRYWHPTGVASNVINLKDATSGATQK